MIYTSRLGVRYNDIVPFYQQRIRGNPKFKIKMLHFFIDTGIERDYATLTGGFFAKPVDVYAIWMLH